MKKAILLTSLLVGGLGLGTAMVLAQGGSGAVLREARVTQVVKDVKILASQAAPLVPQRMPATESRAMQRTPKAM